MFFSRTAIDKNAGLLYNIDKGGVIMEYSLDEKKVLKKLEIDDFRHMTKDKIVQFTSLLPNMEPEVAKKALEQFPEFKNLAIEVVKNLQQSVEGILKSNDAAQNNFYDACNRAIDDLNIHLSSDDLTPDQEKTIREDIIKILDMMYRKDSENKAFLLKVIKTVGMSAAVIALAAASLLGGNITNARGLTNKHKH